MSISRVVVAASVAFGASVASASAQGYSWTGFYAGVHLGGMTATGADFKGRSIPGHGIGSDFAADEDEVFSRQHDKTTALMGGAQMGFNWRINQAFVAGIETDISIAARNSTTLDKSVSEPGGPFFIRASSTTSNPIEYLGTVRGRFGYLVAEPLLFFVTGGLAYARTNTTSAFAPSFPGFGLPGDNLTLGGRSMHTGYAVGGGLEYAINRNVSFKVEGLYYDLGSSTTAVSFNTSALPPFSFLVSSSTITRTQNFNGAIVRFGINYLF